MLSSQARRIELVGVAGAGKSTLARMLLERHPDWCLADFIHARDRSHWRYFAHSAPGVVRLLARAFRRPLPSWDEVKLCVYASEWHRYLRARPEHAGVTLFDQGPLFALACLLWGGSGLTKSSGFRSWKCDAVDRWAQELDVVVELTAPDAVLLRRINERDRWHSAKGKAPHEAVSILAAHRRAYAEILGEVRRSGRARVVRFDTADGRPEALAAGLSRLLSQLPSTALDEAASAEQGARETKRAATRDAVEELGSIG